MLIEAVFFVLFPIILLLIILILFFTYQETFEKMFFSKREIGLLIIGSAATMFLDMPLFIYKDYFLALNIGGALIPIILSFHFLKKKGIPFQKFLAGVFLVSLSTYMVTRVTEKGVVSYFPFYFLPSILAILLSFLFFFRKNEMPVYAYTIATLGVVIGGDFSHLPELFQQPFAGSMGGAGVYDMVYLAGLISFCLSFPVVRKERLSRIDRIIKKVEREAINAGKIAGIDGSTSFILERLIGEKARDFEILKEESNVKKARMAMNKLVREMHESIEWAYASPAERVFSFLIDFAIIAGISFIFSLFYTSILFPFLIFLLLLQVVYFIPLEFFFGCTVGKALLDIEVKNLPARRADFMSVFTRNIIRYLEFFAGFYMVSFILVSVTPKKQRIGDIIADTIVVKVRE